MTDHCAECAKLHSEHSPSLGLPSFKLSLFRWLTRRMRFETIINGNYFETYAVVGSEPNVSRYKLPRGTSALVPVTELGEMKREYAAIMNARSDAQADAAKDVSRERYRREIEAYQHHD